MRKAVAPRHYAPQRGDLIWLEWLDSDQAPSSVQGHRPGLVLSSGSFQEWAGAVVVVPVLPGVGVVAGGIPLPGSMHSQGVVQARMPRILDYRDRRGVFIERVPGYLLKIIDIVAGHLLEN